MSDLLKHILAVICLVAFVASGQVSACACGIATKDKATSSCSGENHNHAQDHKDHAPDADPTCPCAACHTSCHHVQIVLPTVELPMSAGQVARLQPDGGARPVVRAAEIFNPPKLS